MSEDLHKQIGRLEAHVEALQKSTEEIRNDVKIMTEQMNRWRGAGMVLMLVGAVFGFIIDSLASLFSK